MIDTSSNFKNVAARDLVDVFTNYADPYFSGLNAVTVKRILNSPIEGLNLLANNFELDDPDGVDNFNNAIGAAGAFGSDLKQDVETLRGLDGKVLNSALPKVFDFDATNKYAAELIENFNENPELASPIGIAYYNKHKHRYQLFRSLNKMLDQEFLSPLANALAKRFGNKRDGRNDPDETRRLLQLLFNIYNRLDEKQQKFANLAKRRFFNLGQHRVFKILVDCVENPVKYRDAVAVLAWLMEGENHTPKSVIFNNLNIKDDLHISIKNRIDPSNPSLSPKLNLSSSWFECFEYLASEDNIDDDTEIISGFLNKLNS